MLNPNPNENFAEAVDMFERVRPHGPWILTAINPDGAAITTITARNAEEVRKFIHIHNGKRNLYFAVNPTRHAMDKKATKFDLSAIEYIHGDLDPRDDESPEDAKARYQTELSTYPVTPAEIIDSGNGVQVLFRLHEPIKLAEPVMRPDESGELTLHFPEETAAAVKDVESRAKLLMQTLGSVAGTQNIDRILRIPGTINLPNAKKRKHGRTACPTKSISFSSESYPFEGFPKPKAEPKVEPTPQKGETSQEAFDYLEESLSLLPNLAALVRDGVPDSEDRSAKFFHAVGWLKDRGWSLADILKLLRKYPKGIATKYASKSDRRLKTETERAFNNVSRDDGNDVDDGADDTTETPPDAKPTNTTAPAFSEEAIALRFANRHAHELRHVLRCGINGCDITTLNGNSTKPSKPFRWRVTSAAKLHSPPTGRASAKLSPTPRPAPT